MILSAQSIRCLGSELIQPFFEVQQEIHGLTYGLSCCGYDVRIAEYQCMLPGDFVLASTIEHFDIPDDLLMRICDKSTWARTGIFVQNTVAEPGWHGYLTLEITNQSSDKVEILPGTPIAQVIFERLDAPTDMPYNGKYQSQGKGPVGPKRK